MAWLSQNWIWILVVIAAVVFMSRMHGRGHGMGHASERDDDDNHGLRPEPTLVSGAAVDPVSLRTVAAGAPEISATHHDRIYHFESRADRDAFEADPEKYIAASPTAGRAMRSEPASRKPRRRGC